MNSESQENVTIQRSIPTAPLQELSRLSARPPHSPKGFRSEVLLGLSLVLCPAFIVSFSFFTDSIRILVSLGLCKPTRIACHTPCVKALLCCGGLAVQEYTEVMQTPRHKYRTLQQHNEIQLWVHKAGTRGLHPCHLYPYQIHDILQRR
ncbi:hypothetical protein P5673_020739 [Acropora cervicornis]|uniref:Uncharacterized protein n=1 Tax=Acropora cervicornis TaxID=6130 RepID=A0AAD9Q9J0_ACRCE|nr:hypothetical protein P5673_020739 [Acropora cervicornis]